MKERREVLCVEFEKRRGEKAVAHLKKMVQFLDDQDAGKYLDETECDILISDAQVILTSDLRIMFDSQPPIPCKCKNRLLPNPCSCRCCQIGCNHSCYGNEWCGFQNDKYKPEDKCTNLLPCDKHTDIYADKPRCGNCRLNCSPEICAPDTGPCCEVCAQFYRDLDEQEYVLAK